MGKDGTSDIASILKEIESLLVDRLTGHQKEEEVIIKELKELEHLHLETLNRMMSQIGGVMDIESTIEKYLNSLGDGPTGGTDPRDRGR